MPAAGSTSKLDGGIEAQLAQVTQRAFALHGHAARGMRLIAIALEGSGIGAVGLAVQGPPPLPPANETPTCSTL